MEDWQSKYLELKEQIELTSEATYKIILENNNLKSENFRLSSEIMALRFQVLSITEENLRLKDRSSLNSKNSSIPSSKELYKIKRNSKNKSDKKQGAQVGHTGHLREKLTPNEIITIDLASLKCECGGDIILSEPSVRQKIDIPEIVPHVTDYHLARGRCRVCRKRKSSFLPSNVTRDLFGPRIKAVIGSLSGFYKNSKRGVESILKDLFNVKISLGTISNNESRITKKCDSAYEDIELELSYSSLLHMDETSHYNKGDLGWCWGFFSSSASLIKLEKTRGKKVLEHSVFGKDDAIIVSDRYGAYNYFNESNRQICWSHLSRDFERFANSNHKAVREMGEYLKKISWEIFALKQCLLDEGIDVLRFLMRARHCRKRMWIYLSGIADLKDAVHAARVARNMMKSEKMMWKFLDSPQEIPLTNNHAEQQIRHYVTYRKNSYFTQSERGERFLERMMSLYLTWQKRKQNPVQNLQNLLLA